MVDWPRVVVFVAVVGVVTTVDLWTKQWAAGNLASYEHPLPLPVDERAGEQAVAEFLATSRFPGAEVESLLRLAPALTTRGEELFPVERITSDRGYYIFLTPDFSEAPLFLPNPALKEFHRKQRAEGATKADWKASWRDRKVSWSSILEEEFPFLDQAEVATILEQNRIHPIPAGVAPPAPSSRVNPGEVLLLGDYKIVLLENHLRFIYAENPGAAWGILRDAPLLVRIIFLQVMSGVAMFFILWVVYRLPRGHLLSAAALAGIMGGAVGNFVERFSRYLVIDYIDMYIGDSHWPTYNVADIGITVGVGLLFLQILRKRSPF